MEKGWDVDENTSQSILKWGDKVKYPFVRQHDQRDCGAACLSMIAAYYGLKMPLGKFRELVKTDIAGSTVYGIAYGAGQVGLDADALEGTYDELKDAAANGEIVFPFIAHVVQEDGSPHFVVVYDIKKGRLIIGDPATDIIRVSEEEFNSLWTGYVVTFRKNRLFEKKNLNRHVMAAYLQPLNAEEHIVTLIVLLSLITAGISMFGATIFQYAIDNFDNVTIEKDEVSSFMDLIGYYMPSFGCMCVCVLVLYVFQAFVDYIRNCLSIRLSKKISMPVLTGYLSKITKLPIAFFSGRKTGDLLTRFGDASSISAKLIDVVFVIIIDGLLSVFYVVVMMSISRKLFMVAISIVAIYAILVLAFKKKIRNMEIMMMEANSTLNSYLKETFQGIETIKTYLIEGTVRRKNKSNIETYIDISCDINRVTALQSSLIGCFTSIGIVVLVWYGVNECRVGNLTMGTLMTFYTITGSFLSPMQNLIGLQTDILSAKVAADRLNDVMGISSESYSKDDQFKNGDIVIEDIIFRYGAREEILRRCSLKIHQKDKVAIVGESGCGKSTLAKLLAGFFVPEEGDISVGGVSLKRISPNVIRKHITYVSQDTFLFSDTIRNNLFCDLAETDDYVDRLCEDKNLFKNLPMALDTVIEENGVNLSGGQKQQIAILRAVLRQSDILILDETTSSLDSVTEKIVMNIVEEYRDNLTVILIAHRLSAVKDSDCIYCMKDGKIVGSGMHDELLVSCDEYKELWKSYAG